MLTAAEGAELARIIETHRVIIRPVDGGWVPMTENGRRIGRVIYSDPLQAAQAAETVILGRESRDRGERVIEALQTYQAAPHQIRKRQAQDPETGDPVTVVDIVLAGNVIETEPNIFRALRRIEELVNA